MSTMWASEHSQEARLPDYFPFSAGTESARGLLLIGSGSGIMAAELTRAGYEVLGIDISPAMVRLARKAAPEAKFVVASMFDTEIPPCDAVTSIGECVCYAFDSASGGTALRRLFRRVHNALRHGGVFIFDVATPGIVGPTPVKSWRMAEDWAILSEAIEDKTRRTLERRITTFRKAESHYRRSQEIHRVRLYDPEQVESDLRRAGFEVTRQTSYGRMKLLPSRVAFVARKPVKP